MIRLDKFLCELGAGTRSETKALLKMGRVTVNGAVEKSPEHKVNEEHDRICLDGQTLVWIKTAYYLLHKPAGVVTATKDSRETTVMDLMKGAAGKGLFPAGRLDRDTEGLLLITNDGALAHRLLSPKKHVEKTYLVHTAEPVTEKMCSFLENGVDIGEETPALPAKTSPLPDTDCGLLLTITEGRFHQVKRMLHAVGNEVVYLKRLSMGPLVLEDSLEKGQWRPLTEQEKKDLGV